MARALFKMLGPAAENLANAVGLYCSSGSLTRMLMENVPSLLRTRASLRPGFVVSERLEIFDERTFVRVGQIGSVEVAAVAVASVGSLKSESLGHRLRTGQDESDVV